VISGSRKKNIIFAFPIKFCIDTKKFGPRHLPVSKLSQKIKKSRVWNNIFELPVAVRTRKKRSARPNLISPIDSKSKNNYLDFFSWATLNYFHESRGRGEGVGRYSRIPESFQEPWRVGGGWQPRFVGGHLINAAPPTPPNFIMEWGNIYASWNTGSNVYHCGGKIS